MGDVSSLKSHGPALSHVTVKLAPLFVSVDGEAMTVSALVSATIVIS